ncbi:tyrosine-type recombinase/integrase [Candidatus Poriferisodalis sp.]|uniref:tyrosine-type recombinase/integrase n=1 Tax=Candidatus Poriferisodalis sp. TaxID=3101277 RepID=UPI003B0257F1
MLTDTAIRNARPKPDGSPRVLGDGRYGLALRISQRKDGRTTKTFIQQIKIDGRRTHVGLGEYPIVSLAEAREQALDNLRETRHGNDVRTRSAAAATGALTFADAEAAFVRTLSNTARTLANREREMSTYMLPKIGSLPVSQIRQADIVAALEQPHPDKNEPVWLAVPTVADRLLFYTRNVFDWLVATKQLDMSPISAGVRKALAQRPKKERKHHRAVPWQQIPEAVKQIAEYHNPMSKQSAMRKLGLLFTILTARRSAETIRAEWSQFDIAAARWNKPYDMMKSRKAHDEPLSAQVLAITAGAAEAPWRKYQGEPSGAVFAEQGKATLQDADMLKLVKAAGLEDQYGDAATVHGFRNSFADWAMAQGHPEWLIDIQLAHAKANETEAAYKRSDHVELRREMMQQWAHFCLSAVSDPETLESLFADIQAGK